MRYSYHIWHLHWRCSTWWHLPPSTKPKRLSILDATSSWKNDCFHWTEAKRCTRFCNHCQVQWTTWSNCGTIYWDRKRKIHQYVERKGERAWLTNLLCNQRQWWNSRWPIRTLSSLQICHCCWWLHSSCRYDQCWLWVFEAFDHYELEEVELSRMLVFSLITSTFRE